MQKNLGLNSWEAEMSKEDLALLPKTSVPFDTKITGKLGFTDIESESFPLLISNGGTWEAQITPSANNKNSSPCETSPATVNVHKILFSNPPPVSM